MCCFSALNTLGMKKAGKLKPPLSNMNLMYLVNALFKILPNPLEKMSVADIQETIT